MALGQILKSYVSMPLQALVVFGQKNFAQLQPGMLFVSMPLQALVVFGQLKGEVAMEKILISINASSGFSGIRTTFLIMSICTSTSYQCLFRL